MSALRTLGTSVIRISLRTSSRRPYHRAPEPVSPEVSKLLENYAQRSSKPLTLAKLLSYAQPVTPDSVLASVAYVQQEVPRRLATRINTLQVRSSGCCREIYHADQDSGITIHCWNEPIHSPHARRISAEFHVACNAADSDDARGERGIYKTSCIDRGNTRE
jgi:hypothetical protein